MATNGSPLSSVLKKSLDINYTILSSEIYDWNEAAKKLIGAYGKLVKIHDAIEPKLRQEWTDLAKRYAELVGEMQNLEKVKVGTTDKERQDYTKKVQAVINLAEALQRDMQAEPGKRELEQKYQERSKRVAFLLQYRTENQLEKIPPFADLPQSKIWIEAGPTPNQMNAIVNKVDACEAEVKKRNEVAQKAKEAREAERKAQEEETKRKETLDQAKEEERKKQAAKASQQEQERKQKAAPVEDLLKDTLRAVGDEAKEYVTLGGKILAVEGKLGDSKLGALKNKLEELKKQIEIGKRDALLNKAYSVLAASGPGFQPLEDALRRAEKDLDSLSIKELESLTRDLNKVLENIDTLAGNRSEYEAELQNCDPDLLKKKDADPKVRGYVFTDALGAAQADMKDMVGILGGERRGRTSPNGRANHIHVGGNAQYNAIFDWNGPGGAVRVLGFVNGHMDRRAPPPVLAEASRVEDRNGPFTEVEVDLKKRTMVVV